MQLISNSKQVKYSSQSLHNKFKNVLNENLSQSGLGLAKIGTEWGSGERRSRTEQLSQFHQRIDRRPPFNVWSILKISEVWYVLFESISWHEGEICLQSWHQIPRKVFRLLKLRFRLSFFPGSHHVPWQQKYTKCLWKHSQHQVPYFKQQHSSHAHNNSNMRNIVIKPIKNNFNFSSWCLPQICQQLQVLNAFTNVALAIVIERQKWQQNEPQTPNKTTCKQNCVYCVNRRVSPPFKLKLGICGQPYRPFWKQQVNLELTKSTILLSSHQANSGAFGTLLRYKHQGYTLRYSCVPCICIYPKGENAAVPVIGSWRAVGETHLIRPVTSSITWQGGDLMSFTSRARG